jgi:glycosyltransferase involved in cell wall biosynthesis
VSSSSSLRIVHVFRAPLGGLFRHVIDLAVEQAARGHAVGLFFDRGGDCARVRDAIARIPSGTKLGVEMTPIRRNPHIGDLTAMRAFARYLKRTRPDVVHGHGSKGGVYARFVGGANRPIRAYTPHGGSFNYRAGSRAHAAFMWAERAMARRTDLFLFESDHIRERFDVFVGIEHGVRRVVVNGLGAAEFAPVAASAEAADFLYVGELRAAKGIDTLLDALVLVGRETSTPPSAVLVGSGPDRDALIARAARLGLAASVRFPGPLPVRQAFALGGIMVVPSRAESMPYVVLEAAAAGAPLIATDVGGIPEIFGPYRDRLGPSDDPADLARRMIEELRREPGESARRAAELSDFVKARFSLEQMADTVISAYHEALARRDLARNPGRGVAGGARLVNGA